MRLLTGTTHYFSRNVYRGLFSRRLSSVFSWDLRNRVQQFEIAGPWSHAKMSHSPMVGLSSDNEAEAERHHCSAPPNTAFLERKTSFPCHVPLVGRAEAVEGLAIVALQLVGGRICTVHRSYNIPVHIDGRLFCLAREDLPAWHLGERDVTEA